MKIIVTLREISDAPLLNAWDQFCDKYGYSYYCVKEGADPSTEIQISFDDAKKWGLVDGVNVF